MAMPVPVALCSAAMGRRSAEIQGMAYVPGIARGKLCRGFGGGAGSVALITTRDQRIPDVLPAAICLVEGAPLSHRTISLRELGVPVVLIDSAQAGALEEGAATLVDGATGLVVNGPEAVGLRSGRVPSVPKSPVVTADGAPVTISASVRSAHAARRAREAGAMAIGLVRTEFLAPPDGRPPDRGYFEEAFAALCEAAAPLPVTFRLIDIAADKIPSWIPGAQRIGGAIGLQGTRLYDRSWLRRVVDAQLGALAMLAATYELEVLLPFLTRRDELQYWAGVVRDQLPETVPLGAMVETPLAALDFVGWLDTVSFVAIGCNDLMQCLFAADRDRPELRVHLDPNAPSLFRFLRQVAEGAGRRLADVRLCGLLPQLPGIMPVLLGMGYRTFSVDPPLIAYLARDARSVRLAGAARLAERVCSAGHAREVARLLHSGGPGLPRTEA